MNWTGNEQALTKLNGQQVAPDKMGMGKRMRTQIHLKEKQLLELFLVKKKR